MKTRWMGWWYAPLLAGCPIAGNGPAPIDDSDGEHTATAPDRDAVTGESATSTGGRANGSSTGTGTTEIPPATQTAGACPQTSEDHECSVDADCPSCLRCDKWFSDRRISRCTPEPETGARVGEPCTVDPEFGGNCVRGAVCLSNHDDSGICVPHCTGEWECEDPDRYCVGSSSEGAFACLLRCDPLDSRCAQDETCVPDYPAGKGFVCFPETSPPPMGSFGEPCEAAWSCESSLCIGDSVFGPGCVDSGCCTAYCDLSAQPSEQPCGRESGQTCVPYWGCFKSQPGYERLGVCALPPSAAPSSCLPTGIDPGLPWCSTANDSYCPDRLAFGGTSACVDQCWCMLPCTDVSDCPTPTTGTASPICVDNNQGVGSQCFLSCENGETCPNGTICVEEFTDMPICVWATLDTSARECSM